MGDDSLEKTRKQVEAILALYENHRQAHPLSGYVTVNGVTAITFDRWTQRQVLEEQAADAAMIQLLAHEERLMRMYR